LLKKKRGDEDRLWFMVTELEMLDGTARKEKGAERDVSDKKSELRAGQRTRYCLVKASYSQHRGAMNICKIMEGKRATLQWILEQHNHVESKEKDFGCIAKGEGRLLTIQWGK